MTPDAIHLNACPIFAIDGARINFIGSAFFFRHQDEVLLCTADHVVAGYPNCKFEVFPRAVISAEIILRNSELDLCILRPAKLPDGEIGLTVSDKRDKPGNIQLYVFEFSTTEIVDGKFMITPATRIGNCVRLIQREDIFNSAGQDMLELSFPAIKGASGSAVIEIQENNMLVHGILVANTEHHLLPAHVETVLDKKNDILGSPRVDRRLIFLRGLVNEQKTWIFSRSTGTRGSVGVNHRT